MKFIIKFILILFENLLTWIILFIPQYLLSRVVVSSVGGIPKYNVDEDTVIRYMWDVHQAAVDVGKLQLSDV